jgi:hypothetical protein
MILLIIIGVTILFTIIGRFLPRLKLWASSPNDRESGTIKVSLCVAAG